MPTVEDFNVPGNEDYDPHEPLDIIIESIRDPLPVIYNLFPQNSLIPSSNLFPNQDHD